MNKTRQVIKYLIADFLSASAAWTVLFVFRKKILEPSKYGFQVDLQFDENYFYGLVLIPLFWITLYVLTGQYNRIFRRYRLKELGQTITISIFGVIILFFVLLLDDQIASYKNYYQTLLVLFTAHFGITFLFRLILTTQTVRRVHSGKIGFNTIIVGGNERALLMYEEITALQKSPGFKFLGFVQVNGNDNLLTEYIPCLGKFQDLTNLIQLKEIEEVIIAIESSDHKEMGNILNYLEGTGVNVKIIPDMYDILSGSVKMSSIFGTPLIEINRQIMPTWQFSIKRIMDIVLSFIALIALLPVYLIVGIIVKCSSPGPVFFIQERIGLHGRPFRIIKFRTMKQDAEKNGPRLSSEDDERITPFGKYLRKLRIDELPQFFNVLKGDMALVGPRPERQYFINKIMEEAPHYRHLQKVRPGITSWGMVKYGYASSVNEMIARLKYDVLYIENMSLALDIKILFYTILIVIQGRGK